MAVIKRQELLAALPESWRVRLADYRLQSVQRGMSDAQTFCLHGAGAQTLYLKAAAPPALRQLQNEIERTRWLATRQIRVPAILDVFDDGEFGVALMTALPGCHPHEAAMPATATVAHLARGLRALHAVAAADCPFDETTTVRLARAGDTIAQGDVDPDAFDERNRGRAPLEIYRRLTAAAPRVEDDIVLVHGDATFDNLLIDADGTLGFIDCGHAGRGDRHLDLQAIASDIDEHFGPQAIEAFARAYGRALDPAKLRFFDDLYELF